MVGINLLLAIHNHQPVGNFGHVFEKAFKECYWPLIKTIAEFPKVKVSLHHSGPLLDWAKEHEPVYLPALVRLIGSGQVEPLGGGYYEPILAVIPPNDAAGQIAMMRDFWKRESGVSPRGIWMTERIWEPSLASLLAENGVEYTILDDEHFRAAGMTDEFILDYYLTERHGKTTAIFASDQKLRYYIPFKMPEDVVGHLLYLADRYPGSAITYGDDGEKLGLWPGTFEWVVKKGWLKKFFQLLTENSEKIKCSTISEYFDGHKPAGTVYLPTCSYHEMGEWAMPAHAIKRFDGVKEFLTNSGKWDEAKPFVRGGYWDNFLTKYPESNYMHKRMLYVSEKLEKAMSLRLSAGFLAEGVPTKVGAAKQSPKNTSKQEIASSADGLPPSDWRTGAMTNARRALYRAQCNCPYWHGLFGGLYLNYLRHAVYKNLIEAEDIIERSLAASRHLPANDVVAGPPVIKVDIDCDRSDEFILRNDNITAVVKPNRGAGLVELSHIKSGLNLQDVLTRREEAYHTKKENQQKVEAAQSGIPSIHDLNKDPSSAGKIVYDVCERFSFLERIWPANASSSDIYKNVSYVCKVPFELSSQKAASVTFTAKPDINLTLIKAYFIGSKPDLKVQFGLKFKDPVENEFRFGTELNLTLLAGHDDKRYYLFNGKERKFMDASGSIEGSDTIKLVDEYFGIGLQIKPDRKMDLWYYPVNTVSQSETGFDLLYQGSCIMWSTLVPKGTREFEFAIELVFD